MRRRTLAVSLIVLSGVVAACSDSSVATDPGLVRAKPGTIQSLSETPTVEELIEALFEGPNEQSASSQWKNIQKDVANGDPNSLQSHINNITKWVLEQLTDGQILDPDGAGPLNPTSGSVKLLAMVFTFANKFPTSLPPLPAGFDAGWMLLSPTATDNQTLVTSFGDAAAVVPPGTFDQTTLLVIVRQPDELLVNTPYPKLSKTIDVAIAPEVSFEEMTVLMCPAEGIADEVTDRAVIAHQKSATEVEYLDPAIIGNLTCPHDIGAAWREQNGLFRQRAMQLASYAGKAWRFFGPKPLYAGHAAIGGRVGGTLSPMVAVDPLVATTISVNPIDGESHGETIEVSATLAVAPDAPVSAGAPLAGQTLVASLDGGAPQQATTDANGVATWQFVNASAGSHSVSVSFAGASTPENAPLYGASSASTSFTTARAPLTVQVLSATYPYGSNPCVVTYSGFKGSDGPSSLSGTLTCTRNGQPLSVPAPSGLYVLTPGGLTSTNYEITFVAGTVRVRYNIANGFLTPIPNTQFGAGRTIPVKFQLFQPDGSPVTTATATVSMTGVTVPPNEANFVYNASNQTYAVNLNTPRTVALGVHTIRAHLDDGQTISVNIIIK